VSKAARGDGRTGVQRRNRAREGAPPETQIPVMWASSCGSLATPGAWRKRRSGVQHLGRTGVLVSPHVRRTPAGEESQVDTVCCVRCVVSRIPLRTEQPGQHGGDRRGDVSIWSLIPSASDERRGTGYQELTSGAETKRLQELPRDRRNAPISVMPGVILRPTGRHSISRPLRSKVGAGETNGCRERG